MRSNLGLQRRCLGGRRGGTGGGITWCEVLVLQPWLKGEREVEEDEGFCGGLVCDCVWEGQMEGLKN